jgi:signal transduction histidine kinase
VLSVRDSGPGIAPDSLPRVFEPFFTTRSGGLGLGLSLAQSLAEAFGGTLTAGHAAPRGAEFRLTLPLAGDQAS